MTTPEIEPDTIAEIEEDIERTRARLGDTVDELSHRLDVKGRAHDKVVDLKVAAQERAADVKSVVHDRSAVIGSQVADLGGRVRPVVRRREVQAGAAGAIALCVGMAVLVHRKH